ncbi:transposase [Erysipelotrichaceae bacterium RD49]|nr:transposase [Erysipelotrichaceae bacterium RD49]
MITVITNLDPEEFITDDIKEIYRLRWQEEIGFRILKGSLALDSIHSRKEENIIGEIFAKLTLYNLCSRVRNTLKIRKLKKKHIHKLDFGFAINLIWDNLFVSRLIRGRNDLIKKRTQPERPNRADPRKK